MDFRELVSEFNRADKSFNLYMLCSSLLILKIMVLIVFTILTRMRNKVSNEINENIYYMYDLSPDL